MPAIVLTPAQRKEHRALAHHLEPVVMIGGDGLSAAVLREIDAGQHDFRIDHPEQKGKILHRAARARSAGEQAERLDRKRQPVSFMSAERQHAAAVDKSVFPGAQGGPLVHIMAAKAICFLDAATPEFVEYQKHVVANAKALADELTKSGFRIVSGGTDTHVLLCDVFAKGVKGKEAQTALESAHITANRNTIPFDTNPPFNPSGMRFGSPAVTTRGFREAEMRQVARLIATVLEDVNNQAAIEDVRKQVAVLTERFPLYAWRR